MTDETNETVRIAVYSDGIFAVAITLLVLDIHVPPPEHLPTGGLSAAFLAQWPVYLAYVTSFLTILVMWINHHKIFQHIRWADHGLMIYNGLLLMDITLVPFPTSLAASYIRQPDARIAVGLLNGLTLLIAVAFNLL